METNVRSDIVRVVVTGSECTGKTTLARQLAESFGVEWVPEYVREYAAAKAGPIVESDHDAIARGQIAVEDALARRAGNLVIQDTDLLSTVVYGTHYMGHVAPWIAEAARVRRPSLYLLMDIDIQWVADGVRDRGDRRGEMHTLFLSAVERSGVPWVLIEGPWEERFARARVAVDSRLAGSGSGAL